MTAARPWRCRRWQTRGRKGGEPAVTSFDIGGAALYSRSAENESMRQFAEMNLSRMTANAAKATSLLKALANKHRLVILCHLAGGEKSVGELEELLAMRQPHLSQHLARLRRDELVKTRRASRTIFYGLGSRVAGEIVHLLYQSYCAPRAAKRMSGRTRAGSETSVQPTPRNRPKIAAAGGRNGITRRL
jgi:DNA-binding transcriptional ArsR family regulator